MGELPANVDEYIAAVPSQDAQSTLEYLRRIILDEVPGAKETISYRIPTYKYHGFLASIAAFKGHCSFFPGHTVADFQEELSNYKTRTGTIQFPHNSPPPEELIRAILRRRADENAAAKKA